MIIKGTVNADSGVKEFKNDRGELVQFRHLIVVELGNSKLIKLSVPLDYKAPALGSAIEVKAFCDKATLASEDKK